jgi:hypothetical protein
LPAVGTLAHDQSDLIGNATVVVLREHDRYVGYDKDDDQRKKEHPAMLTAAEARRCSFGAVCPSLPEPWLDERLHG